MKKILIVAVVLGVLYVLYYAISPVFDVQEVDDIIPVSVNVPMASGFEELSEEDQTEMLLQMSEVNETQESAMDDDMDMLSSGEPAASAVQSTAGHPASGVVRVFDTADGQVVRFEDFETINGPRLHVYLSKDLEGDDYIDLGPIRGTTGNINYEIPDGVDLSEYKYIMHWCVPFGVLFNYAELL